MRNVLAVFAAAGALLLGCDGAGNRASAPPPPAASSTAPKAETSASKKVSEVLIRYCSS